jgi:hypothetical protein
MSRLWMLLAVAYVGLWLALALACSIVFRRAATSALVAIAIWLMLTLFASLLVGVVAGFLSPLGPDATTADQIANGSRGLLDEVAVGKVTGEEEYWSRTDLWDFQANLDGSWKGFELLEPVIKGRDASLAEKISYQFGAVQGLLDATKRNDEFVTYDKLTKQQVKAMSDAVNALGESMAEVSAVL